MLNFLTSRKKYIQVLNTRIVINSSRKNSTNPSTDCKKEIRCMPNRGDEKELPDEKIRLAPIEDRSVLKKLSFRSRPKGGQTKQDNNALAFIMMGYVLVFLVCHFPRLLLNIYELATIR